MLPPFSCDGERRVLFRVLELPAGVLARASTSDFYEGKRRSLQRRLGLKQRGAEEPRTERRHRRGRGRVRLKLESSSGLGAAALSDAKRQVAACLRLEEDLTPFYQVLSAEPSLAWARRLGAGRLLRSPSVFEDVMKMICTTNCTWKQTVGMVERLVESYGPFDRSAGRGFPRPEGIASGSEASFARAVRAGYRSRFLYEVAEGAASGRLDLESLRTSPLNSEMLYKRLLALPGVGPYAAASLLKLLGRYDRLGVDSWCRKKFAELYRRGRPASDRAMERFYRRFAPFQGLAMWIDLTRDWIRAIPLSGA